MQSRRRRLGVLLLLCAIVGLWGAGGFIAVRVAQESRVRLALERNLTIAKLSARLIDEQADGAVSTIRDLGKRFPLESALLREDRKELHRYLSTTVELVPDLLAVMAYRADGRVIASYPQSYPPPSPRESLAWLRGASEGGRPTVSDVIRLPDPARAEALALVFPVGPPGRVHGYLVAYYRLTEIDEWLKSVRFGDRSAVYVINDRGKLISSTRRDDSVPDRDFAGLEAVRVAHGAPAPGSILGQDIDGRSEAAIGYARAAVPNWTVLAVQPTAAALAPTNYLAGRLAGLMIPIVVGIIVTTLLLLALYERQQRLSQSLENQNEELRKADQVKTDFLANVSHDLRTPLASVRLCLSGVLESPGASLQPEARETLEMASEEIDHLTRRVRNLLDMSKLEAGVQAPAFELADLTDVVSGALERLGPLLAGRRVEADFPPEPLLVECDQGQMEIVVMNLVENACKYSPPESPLRLRGWAEREVVMVSVSDEGPGVAADEAELIFTKFYRAQNNRPPAGGAGLGLAIARTVVESHGGSIGVRPGKGAEFWFALPGVKTEVRMDGGS